MSDLSQSEREAMEEARESAIPMRGGMCRAGFALGWRAAREFSRSPEAIERAAKAIYEDDGYAEWEARDERAKEGYRSNARAAIAALDATSEKEKADG